MLHQQPKVTHSPQLEDILRFVMRKLHRFNRYRKWHLLKN